MDGKKLILEAFNAHTSSHIILDAWLESFLSNIFSYAKGWFAAYHKLNCIWWSKVKKSIVGISGISVQFIIVMKMWFVFRSLPDHLKLRFFSSIFSNTKRKRFSFPLLMMTKKMKQKKIEERKKNQKEKKGSDTRIEQTSLENGPDGRK